MDGFGDVLDFHIRGVREVGDGARELENPVVCAGGEVELRDRGAK